MSIQARTAALFPAKDVVCGGHGARLPQDTLFTVPKNITIRFYCADNTSLPNDEGQVVDQVVNNGPVPAANEVISGGGQCWNYRLFSRTLAAHLNLGMSKAANERYIEADANLQAGLPLADICRVLAMKYPFVTLHWSACRDYVSLNGPLPAAQPDHSAVLAAIQRHGAQKNAVDQWWSNITGV